MYSDPDLYWLCTVSNLLAYDVVYEILLHGVMLIGAKHIKTDINLNALLTWAFTENDLSSFMI